MGSANGSEVRAGRYFGREDGREKTFTQFIDHYIEKELPKNPKAYAKQKLLLTWWKSHLGKYFLCHITPSIIAELRDVLMSETTPRGIIRTPSTANRYLAALSLSLPTSPRKCHAHKNILNSQPSRPYRLPSGIPV